MTDKTGCRRSCRYFHLVDRPFTSRARLAAGGAGGGGLRHERLILVDGAAGLGLHSAAETRNPTLKKQFAVIVLAKHAKYFT